MFSLFETLFIVSITLIYYVYYKLTFWKRQNIPNLINYNIKALGNPIHSMDQKCVQKYGNIVGTYELLKPSLMIAEPELIAKVLISNFKDFSEHRMWTTPENALGDGLLLQSYQRWKMSRPLISPTFSNSKLKMISCILEKKVNSMNNTLDKMSENKESVDITSFLDSFIMDISVEAFFGIKFEDSNSYKNEIMSKIQYLFHSDITLSRIFSLFFPKIANIFEIQFFDKQTLIFITELIEKVIGERKRNNIHVEDFLQYLLDKEHEDKNSRKWVIDNCLVFIFASYDTTSATLAHLIYNLATNPITQDKLIEEVDQNQDSEETLLDKFKKMPYLDICLKETLRLFPAVSRQDRKAVNDTKLSNIYIPKGCYIMIPTFAIHRDPNNYENPDHFIPERFSPENINLIKPGSYIPFSDGPRNCVGMKFANMTIKFCIYSLLKRYRFLQCNQTKDLKYSSGFIILKPKNLILNVVKRSSN